MKSKEQNDYYKIVQQTAKLHPLFYSELYSGFRVTHLGIDVDYTIIGIIELLKEINITTSKKLWQTLLEYGEYNHSKHWSTKFCSGYNSNIASYCDIAMYSPNGSAPVKSCDSSLVYYLRKSKWIPDKNGFMFLPADITTSELHNDFSVSDNNLLIKALRIGENRLDNSAK